MYFYFIFFVNFLGEVIYSTGFGEISGAIEITESAVVFTPTNSNQVPENLDVSGIGEENIFDDTKGTNGNLCFKI